MTGKVRGREAPASEPAGKDRALYPDYSATGSERSSDCVGILVGAIEKRMR